MSAQVANKPRYNQLSRPFGAVQEVGQFFDQLFYGNGPRSAGVPAWFAPASLWEDSNHYYVEVELPGVEQDDIEVVVEKETLRVSAERRVPEGERKYWHQERSFGRVERVVSLPETVDGESIDAELKEGILFIRLAKKPESLPKRVTIKSA